MLGVAEHESGDLPRGEDGAVPGSGQEGPRIFKRSSGKPVEFACYSRHSGPLFWATWLSSTQGAQYPLVKEYTSNDIGILNMIQGYIPSLRGLGLSG